MLSSKPSKSDDEMIEYDKDGSECGEEENIDIKKPDEGQPKNNSKR